MNNLQMENIRKTQAYQAVITDLALEGVISASVAESLLGYEIPDYLHSPSGKTIQREQPKAASAKEEKKQKADKKE